MIKNFCTKIESSFLSCEKDLQLIIEKLFVTSGPYGDILKKLLVVNTKDCLDNKEYDNLIQEYDVARLIEDKYIKFTPKLELGEHQETQSYLIFRMDNFETSDTNPQFRDCFVYIDIICNMDTWELGDFRLRPLKIAGCIDGLLNNSRLSGIGTFQFIGCNQLLLDSELSGYTLVYQAYHGSDDKIESE